MSGKGTEDVIGTAQAGRLDFNPESNHSLAEPLVDAERAELGRHTEKQKHPESWLCTGPSPASQGVSGVPVQSQEPSSHWLASVYFVLIFAVF